MSLGSLGAPDANGTAAAATDLYSTFEFTGGFVAVNVVSTLFMVTNVIPLQNCRGYKAAKDANKCFCEGHYYNWGMYLGTRQGDLADGYTQFFMIPLILCAWAPCGLTQVYTVMATIYWSLNCLAIVSQLQQLIPMDRNVKASDNQTTLLFVMGSLPLLNALYRLAYFAMPNVPGDGVAFAVMFGVWSFICIVHAAITTGRAYTLRTKLTQVYMSDLWTAHDWHFKNGNSVKWPKGAFHPDGFDPLTMGPTTVLQALRDETKKPLASAAEIDAHIEEFMDANTKPMSVWLSMLVLFFAVLLAVPPVIGTIVA